MPQAFSLLKAPILFYIEIDAVSNRSLIMGEVCCWAEQAYNQMKYSYELLEAISVIKWNTLHKNDTTEDLMKEGYLRWLIRDN